jgi:hypothetical protein
LHYGAIVTLDRVRDGDGDPEGAGMRGFRQLTGAAGGIAVLLSTLLTAMPAAAGTPGGGVHRVSRGDPFAGCTLGGDSTGIVYPGAEVEPDVSVDPRNPGRVIGVFQQDRWSDGAARGLSAVYSANGRDFAETTLPFSACAPGGLPLYSRASDPWVSFGPDGTAYATGLGDDPARNATGVMAATSYDGGRSWRHATDVIDDPSAEFGDDKTSVTADPARAGTAYVAWDRLDFGPGGNGSKFTGPAMLAVTHDSGHTWSQPQVMVDTAANQQTIGNIIVGDPRTGRLYDFFDLITYTSPAATTVASADESVVFSDNGGRTWSAPVTAAADTSAAADRDPNNGDVLRTGGGLPSVAIDPLTGELYLAVEGTDFTAGAYDQIQLVHSADGGRTWSRPVRVNGAPRVLAFTPAVAVNADGVVAVSYYDIRTLQPGNTTTLPTSTWLATSPRGGEHFTERRIAAPFDLLSAPNAGGYFVGDYEGLSATGTAFRPLFVETNPGQPANPTDVFTGVFPPGPAGTSRAPAASHPVTATPRQTAAHGQRRF